MARIADKHGLTNKYRPIGMGKRVVRRGRPRKYLFGPPSRRRRRITKKEYALRLELLKITMWLFAAILIIALIGSVLSDSPSSSNTPSNSNQPTIPTVTPIEFSLNQYSSTELKIAEGEYSRVTFDVIPFDTTEDNVEIIISNESIVECTFWTSTSAGIKKVVISVKGKTEGSTTICLKDKNSVSQSVDINVTVVKAEEEVDNSRTVYVNLNGDKYHYSKSCAGKSAYATTYDQVRLIKDPCDKCVH